MFEIINPGRALGQNVVVVAVVLYADIAVVVAGRTWYSFLLARR